MEHTVDITAAGTFAMMDITAFRLTSMNTVAIMLTKKLSRGPRVSILPHRKSLAGATYAITKYTTPSPKISLTSMLRPLGRASFHAVRHRTRKSKTMVYMNDTAKRTLSVDVITQPWPSIQDAERRTP